MLTNFVDYAPLGLEPRDIRVYEALYRLKRGSLRAIAETTGLNRGTVYEIVKKLIGLGLVSFTQIGERRHYHAAKPDVLVSLIRERRDQLQQLEATATTYASQLRSAVHQSEEYTASFYEGDEGVASILRDVLQTVQQLDEKVYCTISSRQASSFIYSNFKSFSRQRVKLGIRVRVLSDTPPSDRLVLAERRQLPLTSQQSLNGYIMVYGDKTTLISLSDTNELSGIVITDRGTANMQRLIFEQLWQSSGGAS
ncbi:MAG TPA: helix-turn-helix domain-containing protein [Candidatus Saccharimonadales bacterium]|nr:helix-turn-helix domain-containing protein [Candidatus Saccharimonadales bacterium]